MREVFSFRISEKRLVAEPTTEVSINSSSKNEQEFWKHYFILMVLNRTLLKII